MKKNMLAYPADKPSQLPKFDSKNYGTVATDKTKMVKVVTATAEDFTIEAMSREKA